MSAVPQPSRLLSAAALAKIDREIAKYPAEQRQSAAPICPARCPGATGPRGT
jgi:hypothetical protein